MSVSAMALAGYSVAGSAWRALRINRAITINLLMTIAAVGLIIGAYTEAAVVMVLFVIGEALAGVFGRKSTLLYSQPDGSRATGSDRDAALYRLRDPFRRDGYDGGFHAHSAALKHSASPSTTCKSGETIIVKPGERIAMTASSSAVQRSSTRHRLPAKVFRLPKPSMTAFCRQHQR